MVRRCCINNCTESDLTILAHRFPKADNLALKWQIALNLNTISLQELQKGSYVVCTKHFKQSDYRNHNSNCLNTTAVPTSEINEDNERIHSTRGKKSPRRIPPLKIAKRQSNIKFEETVKKFKRAPTPDEERDYIEDYELIEQEEEFSEEEPKIIIPLASNEVFKAEQETVNSTSSFLDDPIEESQKIILIEQCTMTELQNLRDQAVQTTPDKQSQPSNQQSDKDDKIIALLYPKYAFNSKMELVKMLMDKDLKIASMEEKEKQLESLLSNLL